MSDPIPQDSETFTAQKSEEPLDIKEVQNTEGSNEPVLDKNDSPSTGTAKPSSNGLDAAKEPEKAVEKEALENTEGNATKSTTTETAAHNNVDEEASAKAEAEAESTFDPKESPGDSKKRKLDASFFSVSPKKEKRKNDAKSESSKKRVKSDPSSQKETDDPDQIRKQVEFYFSESNLPFDRHLSIETKFTENKPVPIKHIHSFARMRRFQPYSAVVKALKESEVLEVTADEEIRRKVALTEDAWLDRKPNRQFLGDPALDRSIYAKGFGEEKVDTQYRIEQYFAQFGKINAVRLRREQNQEFKGSVFVEFNDEAAHKKFLERKDEEKAYVYKASDEDEDGSPLEVKSKRQYCEEKAVFYAEKNKNKPNGSEERYRGRDSNFRSDRGRNQGGNSGWGRGNGRGRGRRGGGRAGRGSRDYNERLERSQGSKRPEMEISDPTPETTSKPATASEKTEKPAKADAA